MFHDLVVIGAGTLLGARLALTIVNNLPVLDVWAFQRLNLGRWGNLVPSWSFFAPLPANSDYALLVRDRLSSGDFSAWREVGRSAVAWTPLRALWNPEARTKKALSDACSHLMRLAARADGAPDSLVLSVPYLLLLNFVSALPRSNNATGRQFAVVRHSRVERGPRVRLVSHVHDLGG